MCSAVEISGIRAGEDVNLVEEIKAPGQRIDHIVELVPNDPELRRAWHTFPDPVADNHGFSWDYVATELRSGSRASRMVSLKQLNGPTTILTIQFNYMLCPI